MLRFVASRIVTALLVILGAMLLLFLLSAVVPGDPASTLLGPQATPEFARQFIVGMGLDQPIHIRLWRFFASILSGDLGNDVVSGRSVVQPRPRCAALYADADFYRDPACRDDGHAARRLRSHPSRFAARYGAGLRVRRPDRRAKLRHRYLSAADFRDLARLAPGAGCKPHGRGARRGKTDDSADAVALGRLDRLHRSPRAQVRCWR